MDTDTVMAVIMARDLPMLNLKLMLLLMPTTVIMAVDTVTVMDSDTVTDMATADGGARGPLMPNLKPKLMPGTADTMVDTDMVVITAVLTDTDTVDTTGDKFP